MRVTAVTATHHEFEVPSDNDLVTLDAEDLPVRLRPFMAPQVARRVMDILSRQEGEPVGRSGGAQYIEFRQTLREGGPEEQAALLHRLYRCEFPLDASQERFVVAYEEALFSELARVLETTIGSLRNRLHQGQPAFGYTAPERDESPVPKLEKAPEGWKSESAFRLYSGLLVVGEAPLRDVDDLVYEDARANLPVKCRRGLWYVLLRDMDGEHSWEYVLIHHDELTRLDTWLASTSELGAILVRGGSLAAIDDEVRGDGRYERALSRGSPLGRGFTGDGGGYGRFEVFAAHDGDDAVLIHIPY
ncbi:hypothetical protein LZ199_26485 [Myxococcus sp. QH3KD-4-1]|nr:hypothetical protein [Myxococcus qinghaiensis]